MVANRMRRSQIGWVAAVYALNRRSNGSRSAILAMALAVGCLSPGALALQFAGGTGEPNDPYQIAAAEQLVSIGSDANLLSKHYVLVADIDLAPNRPGGNVFTKAVIGDSLEFPFSGQFDGNSLTIRGLRIKGGSYMGLFGRLTAGAEVRDLAVEGLRLSGSSYVGGLVGLNLGRVVNCHSTGIVIGTGEGFISGLIGYNGGAVINCYSAGEVTGTYHVGGLAGENSGSLTNCYSSGTGMVAGDDEVGGLVGANCGTVACCYSVRTVHGKKTRVGGLVGANGYSTRYGGYPGLIANSYSTGAVISRGDAGGLAGINLGSTIVNSYCSGVVAAAALDYLYRGGGFVGTNSGIVAHCFWDRDRSDCGYSGDGTGLSTPQMKEQSSFVGWDFAGESINGTEDIWTICEGEDYPRLWWEGVNCNN